MAIYIPVGHRREPPMTPPTRDDPDRMTAEELRAARKRLGMTGKEFAKAFMVSSGRQVYALESGVRDGRPAHVNPAVAFLIRQRMAQLDKAEAEKKGE
jgi:transcriptional regulator with XRE-family HTH domain